MSNFSKITWIDVENEKGLPSYNKKVLLYSISKGIQTGFLFRIIEDEEGKKYHFYFKDSSQPVYDISHWAELPEVPKTPPIS